MMFKRKETIYLILLLVAGSIANLLLLPKEVYPLTAFFFVLFYGGLIVLRFELDPRYKERSGE